MSESVADRGEASVAAWQRRARRLSALCNHLQQSAELEKSQIARRLHDELGGLLVATKMDIVWLRRRLDGADPAVASHWDRVVLSLEQAIDCKRRVIEELRPTLLDNLGFVPALRWLVEEASRAAGLDCEQRYPPESLVIGAEQSIALFRVVQEALANIVHHAQASRVEVEVSHDQTHLTVLIRDDGIGIPIERLDSDDAHGIAVMRERLLALGGEFSVGVTPAGSGHGTTVIARIPLTAVSAT